MECAQLNITGGGNAGPETVSIPGLYSAMDPGIYLNIYDVLSNYTVPGKPKTISVLLLSRADDLAGPAVFTC